VTSRAVTRPVPPGAPVSSLPACAAVTLMKFRFLTAASGVRLREVLARHAS
jgi:hypothetical protein